MVVKFIDSKSHFLQNLLWKLNLRKLYVKTMHVLWFQTTNSVPPVMVHLSSGQPHRDSVSICALGIARMWRRRCKDYNGDRKQHPEIISMVRKKRWSQILIRKIHSKKRDERTTRRRGEVIKKGTTPEGTPARSTQLGPTHTQTGAENEWVPEKRQRSATLPEINGAGAWPGRAEMGRKKLIWY